MLQNKWRRTLWIGIAGVWMLGFVPLRAADSNTTGDKNTPLARWQSLTPDQRKKLLENYHQFKALSPENRDDLRKRWQVFQSLPPEKQAHLIAAYRHFKSLSPEKQAKIRENWKRWQTLTPEERTKLENELNTSNPAATHSKAHLTSHHTTK
jgi:hypothetical protein